MENHEEKQSNDTLEGKIVTFASPTVLAAILDEQLDQDVVQSMVDLNEQDEMVADSLDNSLNDSLESTKLREIGDVGGVVEDTDHVAASDFPKSSTPLHADPEEVPDFPKISTPAQNASEQKRKNTEKAPKPRRSQHIIERNKENVGKRVPAKTGYAQMHAGKARNKLDKSTEKKTKNLENASGSNLRNQLDDEGGDNNDLNKSSHFENHVGQIQPIDMNNSYSSTSLQQQERDLFENSDLNGAPYVFQNHGPYYDVLTQYSSPNYGTHESSHYNQPATYTRGNHSAAGELRQLHAAMEPIPPSYYNNLSTQSAPPGVYGYERKPLLSSLRYDNFSEEDYQLSSVLPNKDFVSSDRRGKAPESSLQRKFSSEPFLAQSSSPTLQKMANVGRNSKTSGSYSSLRKPFEYKPYTLKEYQNFAGSKVKPLAGGLGPNVDTDDFKEKVNKCRLFSVKLLYG